MHLIDQTVGFVEAFLLLLALFLIRGCNGSACSRQIMTYLGDGACEEGILHECLNLASLNNEPILFVVENNLFQVICIFHHDNQATQPRDLHAHNVHHSTVDGNILDLFGCIRTYYSCTNGSRSWLLRSGYF